MMCLLAAICSESLWRWVVFAVKAVGLDWILLRNNEEEIGATGDGEYERKEMVEKGVELWEGRGESYRQIKQQDKDWVLERLMWRHGESYVWLLANSSGAYVETWDLWLKQAIYTHFPGVFSRNAVISCSVSSGHGLCDPCVRCVVMTTTKNEILLTNLALEGCTPPDKRFVHIFIRKSLLYLLCR